MKTKFPTPPGVNQNFVQDIQRLEQLLEESKAQLPLCLQASDPNLADHIHNQLLSLGVCLVRFPSVSTVSRFAEVDVGTALQQTFHKLSPKTKEELFGGDFKNFFAEVERSTYTEIEIAFKSRGMMCKPPLPVLDRRQFFHPLTNAIHIDNPLVAKLGVRLWESLCMLYPLLNPAFWYNESLLQVDHKIQVSEDGVKLTDRSFYTPTPAHFDGQGQVNNPLVGETNRVQVVYCQDSGPVRLFVVPGSNKPEVRQILQRLTRSSDISTGYSTYEKAYPEIPVLREIFYKYGLALPNTGLLMFTAGIWHYEAVQKSSPFDNQTVETRIYQNGAYDPGHIDLSTSASRTFRVYCGLKAIPNTAQDASITHAFLREHNWTMESFSPENKNSPFFVNEKRGQSGLYKVHSHPDPTAFQKFVAVPLPDMKKYLLTHCTAFRLNLYGLTLGMLGE
jgi:hypothetical protein